MKNKNLYSLLTLAIVFVFIFSLFSTVNVLADDATPPPAATEAPVVPDATDVPAATEEPVATTVPVTAQSTTEDITVSEALDQLPDNTQMVVVNEQGETVPLASQEAAQIVATGDPMWCPAGSLPGDAGCTPSFDNFNGAGQLLDFLQTNSGTYNGAGTIYIANNYSSAGEGGPINIDSADYSLTDLVIQGGWDFANNAVTGASTFNTNLNIWNWNNSITLNDLIFNNTGGIDSLDVEYGTGDIVLNNVEASNNSAGRGATLNNSTGSGSIEVNNSRFRNNNDTGLLAVASANLTLTDVFANGNGTIGADLFGDGDVNITRGTFNNNGGGGINVGSNSDITVQGAEAQGNGDYGAYLEGGSVSVDGDGFNSNETDGIYASALSGITLSNVIASNNNNSGAHLDSASTVNVSSSAFVNNNDTGLNISSASLVTVDGVTSLWNDHNLYIDLSGNVGITDSFFNNSTNGYGMEIYAGGNLDLKRVQATGNDDDGLYAEIAGNFTLNDSLFNNNAGNGINLAESQNEVSLTNVQANGNENEGAHLDNSDGTGNMTINSSAFNYNQYAGLDIQSLGIITLDGVTVNANGNDTANGEGAFISNIAGAETAVSIMNSEFSNNYTGSTNGWMGLYVVSSGYVTLNNVIANFNGLGGVTIENTNSSSNAGVSITSSKFNANGNVGISDGLYLKTDGDLILTDVSAGANSFYGADLLVAGTITKSGTNSFNYNAGVGGTDCSDGTNNGVYDNNYAGTWTSSDCAGPDTNVWYLSGGVARNFGTISLALTDIDTSTYPMDDGILHIDSALTPYLENTNIDGSDAELGQITQLAGGGSNSTLIAGNLQFFNFGSGFGVNGLTLSQYIEAWDNAGAVDLTNVKVAGLETSSYNGSGIDIYGQNGNISLNDVDASGIGNGSGIDLDNTPSADLQPITVTNSEFSGNGYQGLGVSAYGPITLTNVVGSFNKDGIGADLCNCASDDQDINITDSTFSYNHDGPGLNVSASGNIFLSNVTANGNDFGGAYLSADGDTGNVTVNNSAFNYSLEDIGLGAHTYVGDISVDGVTANGNHFSGADLINGDFSGPLGTGNISVSNSVFNYANDLSDYAPGLFVHNFNNGNISLSNITANGSYGSGAFLANYGDSGNVTILNSTFNYSQQINGLEIEEGALAGNVFVSGVTSNGNNGDGTYLNQNSSGPGDVTVLSSAFNNSVNGNGLYIYKDGNVVITNVTANANNLFGTSILNSGMVTVDPSSFNNNGGYGLFIGSIGNIILDKVTANSNGADGALLVTSSDASICDSTFKTNLGHGVDASTVGGMLTLNNVVFGGNVSGDYTSGGGGVTVNSDCNPGGGGGGKKKVVDGPGLPLNIVNVTNSQIVELDCEHFRGTKLVLENGDNAILPCPLGDSSSLTGEGKDGLSGQLPDGAVFQSAFTLVVSENGETKSKLSKSATVSFAIPKDVDPSKLSILFWDGAKWVEVGGADTGDGHFAASVNFTGTFVLVQK